MESDYKNIKVKSQESVFFLTFNRPEARNALDADTLNELEKGLNEAEVNESIKVIVIQGAGEKVFAAGADIKQLQEREPLGALVPGMQGIYNKLEESSKVTIAAVEGFALGGGCELA